MKEEELEEYGDSGVQSKDAKVDRWLKFFYISLPIWGVIWFFLFWNGSGGWLDRGYWYELEKAANTMYPKKNHSESPKKSAADLRQISSTEN